METKKRTIWLFNQCGQKYLAGAFLKTTNALAQEGHHVVLSIMAPRAEYLVDGRCLYHDQVAEGVEVKPIGLLTRNLPKWKPFQALKLIELLARQFWRALRHKADLYIAFDVPMAFPILLATRLRRRRHVYFALELYGEQTWVPLRRVWVWLDKLVCPRADAIVAVDEMRARHMLEAYGARQMPLTVRNAPPYREATRERRFEGILQEGGSRASAVALYQGQIQRPRGMDQLVEAAQYLDDHVALFLIGPCEPEYLAELKAEARQTGAEDKVFFLPAVPPHELAAFTASADVGVMVRLKDRLNVYYSAGATNKLYEYLMAGLPVVTPNYPGFPEVVEAEGVGRCVDPTDPRAIAEAINGVLRDPEGRAAMQKKALRLARDVYNWEASFERIHALCLELMGEPEGRPDE